jgi:hypothetical protein
LAGRPRPIWGSTVACHALAAKIHRRCRTPFLIISRFLDIIVFVFVYFMADVCFPLQLAIYLQTPLVVVLAARGRSGKVPECVPGNDSAPLPDSATWRTTNAKTHSTRLNKGSKIPLTLPPHPSESGLLSASAGPPGPSTRNRMVPPTPLANRRLQTVRALGHGSFGATDRHGWKI